MAFRFQRRIKIAPGLRLNISKSGVSVSAGHAGQAVRRAQEGCLPMLGYLARV